MQKETALKFPYAFKVRLLQMSKVKPIYIELEMGNIHCHEFNLSILKNNGQFYLRHKWTVFVQIKDRKERPKIKHLIEKVRFILNYSSDREKEYIEIDKPPFRASFER